jgi:hypothetical protein
MQGCSVYFLIQQVSMSVSINKSPRKDSGRENEPQIAVSEFDNQSPLFVGPLIEDSDIDGLELAEAARVLGISSDEVWRRIRNGILLARTVRGKVLVYTDLKGFENRERTPNTPSIQTESTQKLTATPQAQSMADSLPQIPFSHPSETYHVATDSLFMVPHDEAASRGHQEIVLLIDHLSLAKEENREILRLTQDAMARLTHMTDAMLEMKDSVISSKEEQMAILKLRLSEQSAELIRTLKEKEDLLTLTEALQHQ